MTDADKKLARDLFDVTARTAVNDYRARVLAALRTLRSQASNVVAEMAVAGAVAHVELLPLESPARTAE